MIAAKPNPFYESLLKEVISTALSVEYETPFSNSQSDIISLSFSISSAHSFEPQVKAIKSICTKLTSLTITTQYNHFDPYFEQLFDIIKGIPTLNTLAMNLPTSKEGSLPILNIQYLTLQNSAPDNSLIESVVKLFPRLISLNFRYSMELSRKAFKLIGCLQNLQYLGIENRQSLMKKVEQGFIRQSILQIKGLKGLKLVYLSLKQCEKDLNMICQFQNFTSLIMEDVEVRQEILVELICGCPALIHLELSSMYYNVLTPQTISRILKSCPGLELIQLSDFHFNDKHIHVMSNEAPPLKQLHLNQSFPDIFSQHQNSSRFDISNLIQSQSNLKVLRLINRNQLDRSSLATISKHLNHLQQLNINFCWFNDKQGCHLRLLKTLKTLRIRGNRISSNLISKIVQTLKGLKTLEWSPSLHPDLKRHSNALTISNLQNISWAWISSKQP